MKRGTFELLDTNMHRGKTIKDIREKTASDLSDALIAKESHPLPANRRGKQEFSSGVFRGSVVLPTQPAGLWTVNVYCKSPRFWYLMMTSLGN